MTDSNGPPDAGPVSAEWLATDETGEYRIGAWYDDAPVVYASTELRNAYVKAEQDFAACNDGQTLDAFRLSGGDEATLSPEARTAWHLSRGWLDMMRADRDHRLRIGRLRAFGCPPGKGPHWITVPDCFDLRAEPGGGSNFVTANGIQHRAVRVTDPAGERPAATPSVADAPPRGPRQTKSNIALRKMLDEIASGAVSPESLAALSDEKLGARFNVGRTSASKALRPHLKTETP